MWDVTVTDRRISGQCVKYRLVKYVLCACLLLLFALLKNIHTLFYTEPV